MLPEIRSYCMKARLKRGVEMIKLANRIEMLKQQEDQGEEGPGDADVPASALEATGEALAARDFSGNLKSTEDQTKAGISTKPKLSRLARGAIFREIVLAKVREEKEAAIQKEIESNPEKAKKLLGSK